MDIKEFEIPVPWGHVAVKAWGAETKPPILMVHGFRDNAGSFDQLLPYLPHRFYYICIDLPGHGKSAHFPPHVLIQPINIVFTYKLVMDHLNKKKYIIIGHSWGGQTALLFTHLYPEYVEKLIIIDGVHLYPVSVEYFKQFFKMRFDQTSILNRKIRTKKPPLYTYEEAVERISKNRMYADLTNKPAEDLLKRSLIAVGNGKFRFTGDIRIASPVCVYYGKESVTNLAKECPITCPVLFIMYSNAIPMLQYFANCIKELQKNNNKCFIIKVDGDHNAHMNEPEIVAPIITSFLYYNSKL